MKYALIGCGRIAANHLAAAQQNGLEVVALCDVVPQAMAEKAERFELPDARRYTDYQQMLASEQLDLIAICTESGKHAAIALDCIEAGVNLIIEKPIALALADADAIIRAADARGVKVCACHQNRFNKSIQAMRAALEAGRFGQLLYGTAHIRWNRGRQYYEQAPWRGTWEQDGGALMNQCIHNIDLIRWMMGDEVSEVFAYTDRLAHDYLEAEDMGLAVLRFANGSYGLIEGTTDVYPKNLEETLYLFGSEGTVKAAGTSVNCIEHWAFADGLDDAQAVIARTHEAPRDVYGFGHNPLYADVIQAITDKRAPYVDARAGRRALELVLAIYRSSRDGVPVKLPLDDFSTLDMRGRF
ncbi:MAG: Gfo/Idh/MocA family oxidoreductase [Coriobacteriales bacterium]|nr:Gfo/Idh/MocA family oxidoreductase [Coriobacteriales bacterium]